MADVREMRIFSAEQIQVPEELPEILKDFSKEVIRSNPSDIVKFSAEYFKRKAAENKIRPKATQWAVRQQEHLPYQSQARSVEMKVGCNGQKSVKALIYA